MRLRWSCSLRSPSRLLRLKGVRPPSACGGWALGVRLCGFACAGSPGGAVTIFFFLATDGTAVRSLQACITSDTKVGRKNIKTGRK